MYNGRCNGSTRFWNRNGFYIHSFFNAAVARRSGPGIRPKRSIRSTRDANPSILRPGPVCEKPNPVETCTLGTSRPAQECERHRVICSSPDTLGSDRFPLAANTSPKTEFRQSIFRFPDWFLLPEHAWQSPEFPRIRPAWDPTASVMSQACRSPTDNAYRAITVLQFKKETYKL